jgi:hypothetical protein
MSASAGSENGINGETRKAASYQRGAARQAAISGGIAAAASMADWRGGGVRRRRGEKRRKSNALGMAWHASVKRWRRGSMADRTAKSGGADSKSGGQPS